MENKTEQPFKSGRKPIDDKKIPLTIYLRQSEIDEIGGRIKVRNMFYEWFQQEFKWLHRNK